MNFKKSILFIIVLLSFLNGFSQQFYFIPKQIFNPYKILGYKSGGSNYSSTNKKDNFKMEIDSFQISQQITLGEYKEYLSAVKKDSSQIFYLSQFPDSTITLKEKYIQYITDKKYDNFPAVGITWEAAMNFCKWKTVNENISKSINHIYRLPKISEWLDAYNYVESNKISNDFSKNYSDWTIGLYYEGAYNFGTDSTFGYDVFFLPNEDDPPRNKRMRVIGDSYLFQRENLIQYSLPYYTFKGYRQIGFRIVKVYKNGKETLSNSVIKYWGLISSD